MLLLLASPSKQTWVTLPSFRYYSNNYHHNTAETYYSSDDGINSVSRQALLTLDCPHL